jgi:protoporphyrinogen oxidase
MYDYLIIGGGLTGVSTGRLLQQKGINNFIILEAESEAGGLCRTKMIGDHVLDIGGGHFLCSKYPEVYDFIFSHLPSSEFNIFPRVSKIILDKNIIDYPVESNL